MKRKLINQTTTTYEIKKNYYIDIVRRNDEIEMFLYNIEYGIKDLIIGIVDNNETDTDILDMIEANHIQGYISQYNVDYMR